MPAPRKIHLKYYYTFFLPIFICCFFIWNGHVSFCLWVNYRNEINTTLDKIKELSSTSNKGNDRLALEKTRKQIKNFLDFNSLASEMLHRLIDKIKIKADGNIKIFYRFLLPSALFYPRIINAQHSTFVELISVSRSDISPLNTSKLLYF